MGLNIGNMISSIGGSIFKNLGLGDLSGIINSPIGQAGIGLLEELAKSVFAGGSKGGPFADNIKIGPISLPDPLAKLNPTLNSLGGGITKAADLLGKLGSFLTGGVSALEDGSKVSVPSLPARAGTDSAASSQVAADVASGKTGSGVFAATGGSGSAAGASVFGSGSLGSGLTADQQTALNSITDPQEKARMQAQFNMQNKAELTAFISNIMKMQHDMQMSIIGNFR